MSGFIKKKSKNSRSDQRGMASIIVVTVLVILLSLISIGFARLMDRAVSTSLNNQLSSSAGYAAQSGINDAIAYAQTHVGQKTASCTSIFGAGPPTSKSTINQFFADSGGGTTNNNYKYSCILINPTPPDLEFSAPPSQSEVSQINTVDASGNPQAPTSLLFSWQSDDSDSTKTGLPSSTTKLYDEATWTDASHNFEPLLRVSLYPVSGNTVSQAAARTFFFYPSANIGGNSVAYGPNDGTLQPVNCNGSPPGYSSPPSKCNVVLTGLPGNTSYYVRLTSLYDHAAMAVDALQGSQPLYMSSSQTLLDVTAQAGTASKRLQARVAINSTTDIVAGEDALPEYGLRSAQAICKRLDIGATAQAVGAGGFCPSPTPPPVPPLPPTVIVQGVSYPALNSVTVGATVNPNGNAITDCYLIYGQNASFLGSPTPCSPSITGSSATSPLPVSFDISGLDNCTNYYFKVIATNSAGSGEDTGGWDSTFSPGASCGGSNPTPPGGGGSDPLLTSFYWADDPSDGGPGTCAARYGNSNSPNNCYDWTGENLSNCTLTIDTYIDGSPGGSASFPSDPSGGSGTVGDKEPSTAHLNCGTNTLDLNESSPPPPGGGGVNVAISPPTGNAGASQYWFTFGTTAPQAPNDCRDGVHDYIACFNLAANEGGNYSAITSCSVSSGGSIVNTTFNAAGWQHWSSQGHWITYPIGWSYGVPDTLPGAPPVFPYTYLNNLSPTVSVTCYAQDGASGTGSQNFQWNYCGNRGQWGPYYTDYANNNCSNTPK